MPLTPILFKNQFFFFLNDLLPHFFICFVFYILIINSPSRVMNVSQNVCVCSCSVVSNSLLPFGPEPARLLCPWNFSGKTTFYITGFPPVSGNHCCPSVFDSEKLKLDSAYGEASVCCHHAQHIQRSPPSPNI